MNNRKLSAISNQRSASIPVMLSAAKHLRFASGRMTEIPRKLGMTLLGITLYALACPAATLVTSSIDGGGQRASSASYVNDGCIGGIAGISSAASDTAKHGYIGQLTEVASLTVTGTPSVINQAATSQLTGKATMDDDTITALAGSDIAWGAVAYPFQSVSAGGLLTAVANVYADPVGTVDGSYLGATSNAMIQVLGPYAGGGIPDSWLVQYFGAAPNANAAPTADVTGTGQNNLFKYIAGLDPTNPASIFLLRIAPVAGQPGWKNLAFKPWATGRTYTPQYRLDLSSSSFTTLGGYSGQTTNGNEVSVIDLNAIESRKFYRIKITYQ